MSSPPDRVRQAIKDINDGAQKRTRPLINHNNRSFRTTLIKDACLSAERALDEPGDVTQWWFQDRDLLVIDLSESDNER